MLSGIVDEACVDAENASNRDRLWASLKNVILSEFCDCRGGFNWVLMSNNRSSKEEHVEDGKSI